MSKKAQQKAAQRRGSRKVASRRKVPHTNRGKWNRGASPSMSELQKNLSRYGLENPFDVADRNSEGAEEVALDLPALITKSRETVTNIFQMFSYVTLGAQLGAQGHIDYSPKIDLNDMALRIVQLDRRVINLNKLAETQEEEVVGYELLDISGEMDSLGTILYKEVEVMEPGALAIDAHLNAAALDTFNDPEIETSSMEQAHAMALQSVAMTYIQKHTQPKAA